MVVNTKALFISLLKTLRADLICDVGSRDGIQALLFRDLLPEAAVVAFEANPINYEMMRANTTLAGRGIEMYPWAICEKTGMAQFHITDVDYSNPTENRGTSSLLVHEGLKVLRSVDVETRRLDDFVRERFPNARRIGLWMDVEGVEYAALEGIGQIRDRVIVVHVETVRTPLRRGHKTFAELLPLMTSQGFVLCGSNMGPETILGDVVFVRKDIAETLGFRLFLCRMKGWISHAAKIDSIAVATKDRFPRLYRTLRRAYVRFCT
jgi:FkbM family methyltransferase